MEISGSFSLTILLSFPLLDVLLLALCFQTCYLNKELDIYFDWKLED